MNPSRLDLSNVPDAELQGMGEKCTRELLGKNISDEDRAVLETMQSEIKREAVRRQLRGAYK